MVATGIALRDIAVSKRGYHYKVGPTRCTGADGYFDCSGLVTYAARQLGLNPPTISWLQARWCRDMGTLVSINDALNTPGALLFEGANHAYDGFISGGHVVITIGNGHDVIEAKGHAWGVLVDSALGRPWTNAARMPGVSYVYPPPEVIKVHSDFPAATFVSICTFQHPRYGTCAAGVTPSGAVYCNPSYAWSGGANGTSYFAHRTAATIRPAHAIPGHGEYGYVITDQTGATYGPNFNTP